MKDNYKENKKVKIIILCVLVILGSNLLLCIKNRAHIIESELIYEGDFEGEEFIQILINTEEEWNTYAERYGYDKNIKVGKFDKETVFICSRHKVEQFSYSKKNTRKNEKEVLDVVFKKKSSNKIYIYVLKKSDIISWEATGINPDTKMKFE